MSRAVREYQASAVKVVVVGHAVEVDGVVRVNIMVVAVVGVVELVPALDNAFPVPTADLPMV